MKEVKKGTLVLCKRWNVIGIVIELYDSSYYIQWIDGWDGWHYLHEFEVLEV